MNPDSGSVSNFAWTSHFTQRPSTIGTDHSDFIDPDSQPLPALLRIANWPLPVTIPSAGVPHEPSCFSCIIRPPSLGNETGAPSSANEKSSGR